jgi:hypothetical protein
VDICLISFLSKSSNKESEASPLHFNVVFEEAIRKVQENEEELELNEVHQGQVYANDNLFREYIRRSSMKKAETVLELRIRFV